MFQEKAQKKNYFRYKPKGSYLPLPSPPYHDQSGDLDNAILPPEPPNTLVNRQKDGKTTPKRIFWTN